MSRDIDSVEVAALRTGGGRRSLMILRMNQSKTPERLGIDAVSLNSSQLVPEKNGLRMAFSGALPAPEWPLMRRVRKSLKPIVPPALRTRVPKPSVIPLLDRLSRWPLGIV